MNGLDKFYLNAEKGFAELQPSTSYGLIKGKTHKGELDFPHATHQTVQMDKMAEIILEGKQPIAPVDGAEGLNDLKIIDAIYTAVKSGKKVKLSL
jgi:predicted dehydrogenase